MKKMTICAIAMFAVLVAGAQNYINGQMAVYDSIYIGATQTSGGPVQVGTGGYWYFAGPNTSLARTLANGLFFAGTGYYANAGSSTGYVDGYITDSANTRAFTFPTGDGTETGSVYHPLSLTTVRSAPTTVATSYNFTTTPNNTSLASSLSAVDGSAYWTCSSSTAGATSTVSIATRDLTGVFSAGSKVVVAGYNNTTSKWESVGTGISIINGGETLTTNNGVILSNYSAFTSGQSQSSLLVGMKVFLQGAMNAGGNAMTTNLHSVIPLSQPYNTSVFNYSGTDAISSVPTNMTDWILVDLRDSTTPSTIVATRAALLMSDGTVTDLDGVSPVAFPNQAAGNYYVGFRHRNHLAIRTAATQALSTTTTVYDFTTSQANAYQNPAITSNTAMNLLSSGLFAMIGGNANGNTTVRYGGPSNDETTMLSSCLGGLISSITTSTYSNCDLNMNGTLRYGGPSNDETFLLSTILGGNISIVLTQHL